MSMEVTIKLPKKYTDGDYIKLSEESCCVVLSTGRLDYQDDKIHSEQQRIELSKEDALELSEQLKRFANRL